MQINGSPENNKPEVWLRGPVPGVPALLQPVAHTLLQANEEIHELMEDFPDELLWEQPGGVASVGFHLQHIPGVLDRLFTYSEGNDLGHRQLKYLSEEGLEDLSIKVPQLLEKLDNQVNKSIDHLKTIDPTKLTELRTVGRKKLPSTVIGLLFHAAEHTMRHTGQMLVTARILNSSEEDE
jgi:uncharacterized damage-inducible protein DinB